MGGPTKGETEEEVAANLVVSVETRLGSGGAASTSGGVKGAGAEDSERRRRAKLITKQLRQYLGWYRIRNTSSVGRSAAPSRAARSSRRR